MLAKLKSAKRLVWCSVLSQSASLGLVPKCITQYITHLVEEEAKFMLASALVNRTSGGRRINLVRNYRPRGAPVNYDLALAVISVSISAYMRHDYRPPMVPVTGDFLLCAFRAAEAKRIFDQALAMAQAARASDIRTMIRFAYAVAAVCVILGCAVMHGLKK